MKKTIRLFLTMIFIVIAMQEYVSAQAYRTIPVRFDNISNSVTQTKYVFLGNWAKIDSISLSAAGKGEIDVDSFDVYEGFSLSGNSTDLSSGFYNATAKTFISSLNLDTAVAGYVQCFGASSDATVLTGPILRGANALKIVTRGATSGNDKDDVGQVLYAVLQIWGTPRE